MQVWWNIFWHRAGAPHEGAYPRNAICRSRVARCTQDKGKDLPTTLTQPAMSVGGPGHRNRSVEQRGIQLYPLAGPSQG